MNRYRCIFQYRNACTTVEVDAESADEALRSATALVTLADVTSVEVRDKNIGAQVVLRRTGRSLAA